MFRRVMECCVKWLKIIKKWRKVVTFQNYQTCSTTFRHIPPRSGTISHVRQYSNRFHYFPLRSTAIRYIPQQYNIRTDSRTFHHFNHILKLPTHFTTIQHIPTHSTTLRNIPKHYSTFSHSSPHCNCNCKEKVVQVA